MLITPVASYNPLSAPLLLPLLEPELPPLELDELVPLLEPELPELPPLEPEPLTPLLELPPLELEPPAKPEPKPDGHWVAHAEHSFIVAADWQATDGAQAPASTPVGQAQA
jgi:hypothetical protein